MAILRLLAQLGLDKTGFDAGLISAEKGVDRFSHKFDKKLSKTFGVGAAIAAIFHLGRAMKEVAEDSVAANKEFAKIGQGLSQSDVNLIQEYVKHWDEFGTKMKFIGITVATSFAKFHEAGAEAIDTVGAYLRILGSTLTLNPSNRRTFKEAFREMGEISEFKRSATLGGAKLGPTAPGIFEADSDFAERQRQSVIHMATQDRILELEKEAAEISERTRVGRLTDEERLNELLKERQKLLNELKFTVDIGEERQAVIARDLAKAEAGIAEKDKKLSKTENRFPTMSAGGGGLAGVFLGEAARSSIPAHIEKTNELLMRIEKAMTSRGIVVRDLKR